MFSHADWTEMIAAADREFVDRIRAEEALLLTSADPRAVEKMDGRRFATASLDIVAWHLPNRIRIYRMERAGSVQKCEMDFSDVHASNILKAFFSARGNGSYPKAGL